MTAIVEEINKLPIREKLLLVEKTLKAIRKEKENALDNAVHALYDEYVTNTELTSFTKLDAESFYEAR